MTDKNWVLINTETGEKRSFGARADYLALKYSGGWRDADSTKPRPRTDAARREPPVRREQVAGPTTVETSPTE